MLCFIKKLTLISSAAAFAVLASTAGAVTVTTTGFDNEDLVLVTAEIDMATMVFTGGATSDFGDFAYEGSHWDVSGSVEIERSIGGDNMKLHDVTFTHKLSHDPGEGSITHTFGDSDTLGANTALANGDSPFKFSSPPGGADDFGLHGPHAHEHSVFLDPDTFREGGFNSVFFDGKPKIVLFGAHVVPVPPSALLLPMAIAALGWMRFRQA